MMLLEPLIRMKPQAMSRVLLVMPLAMLPLPAMGSGWRGGRFPVSTQVSSVSR